MRRTFLFRIITVFAALAFATWGILCQESPSITTTYVDAVDQQSIPRVEGDSSITYRDVHGNPAANTQLHFRTGNTYLWQLADGLNGSSRTVELEYFVSVPPCTLDDIPVSWQGSEANSHYIDPVMCLVAHMDVVTRGKAVERLGHYPVLAHLTSCQANPYRPWCD